MNWSSEKSNIKVILGQKLNPDGQNTNLWKDLRPAVGMKTTQYVTGTSLMEWGIFTSFSGILVLIIIINRRFNWNHQSSSVKFVTWLWSLSRDKCWGREARARSQVWERENQRPPFLFRVGSSTLSHIPTVNYHMTLTSLMKTDGFSRSVC